MTAEVVTIVKLPIAEAVEMLRKRHRIKEAFSEVRLEDNFLAFYFTHASESSADAPKVSADHAVVASARPRDSGRKRRARKRRNRMKTRGWPVIAKISNSKGQTAVIYRPFVDALSKQGLSRKDQRAVVEDILRANGNRPSEASVEYFLSNTLEFLHKEGAEVAMPR